MSLHARLFRMFAEEFHPTQSSAEFPSLFDGEAAIVAHRGGFTIV